MAALGQRNLLRAVRAAPPGVYLDGGNLGEILLPRRYTARVVPGDEVDVFVYRDSEDRLVATTEIPRAMVGEFASLEVVKVHPQIGAFLDWGLSKDLLLPKREQMGHLRPRDRVTVYLSLDAQSDRIVATMRLDAYLDQTAPSYDPGQRVGLLVIGKTPLGYNAIVENAHRGLLYHGGVLVPLRIGEKLDGFIREVRPDGKIDLTLDAAGYARIAPLTETIMAALHTADGRLEFDDASSPEAIRARFDVSKKAFKQALGALFRERRIHFARGGIELVPSSETGPI